MRNIKKILCLISILWFMLLVPKNAYASDSLDRMVPIHNFNFNTDVGSSVIDSASGSTTTGTTTGTNLISGYDGSGKARHFDGSSYISFNDKVIPVGKKTISFKIRKDGIQNVSEYVFSNTYDITNQYGIWAYIYNGKIIFIFHQNETCVKIESSKIVCDNQWHDILFTWDGTKNLNAVKLYIDDMSKPDSTVTSSFTDNNPATCNLYIGSQVNAIHTKLTGDLDEFKVYNNIYVNAPYNVTASTINDSESKPQIKISWCAVAGADNYRIERSDKEDSGYTVVDMKQDASYIDNNVEYGKTYYYRIQALESNVYSDYSKVVSVTPIEKVVTEPIILTATGGDSNITLSWNSVKGAESYIIKRSLKSGGPYDVIVPVKLDAVSVSGSAIVFTDNKDLKKGTTYYYVVSAVNTGGESANSNEVSAILTTDYTNAILEITMTNGNIKEYSLTYLELDSFLTWYDSRSNGTDKSYFRIQKKSNIKPFKARYEYLSYDKIYSFEVKEYDE